MNMCIFMYTHAHVCMNFHVCESICSTYVDMCACMHEYRRVLTYIYIHILYVFSSIYTHMHRHYVHTSILCRYIDQVYINMDVYVCIYIYICIHAYTRPARPEPSLVQSRHKRLPWPVLPGGSCYLGPQSTPMKAWYGWVGKNSPGLHATIKPKSTQAFIAKSLHRFASSSSGFIREALTGLVQPSD